MLEWRNTPRVSDGFSPAQWAFGRRQRSGCPALPKAYDRIKDEDFKKALARREEMVEKAKVDFDGDRKILPGFPIGAHVYSQDFKNKRWNHRGTIVVNKNNRTYGLRINGRLFWRNRKFLKLCRNDSEDSLPDQNIPEETEPEPELRRSKRQRTKKRIY